MHLQRFVAAVLALVAAFDVILGIGIIVPGTKWCGPGNIALNYDDLGVERELDMCCRAHDNCQEKIPPQEKAYGLSNDGIFPIFSCACESAFRNCLTALRNTQSLTLGRIYFRGKDVCFANGHPTVSCRENQVEMFEKRCLSYRVDETQPKRWQFYDLAFYTHVEEGTED
ncbi:phospholipase A2 large subunit [Drosophila guanche]|uniref:Phospholipase A2 n=1 Tax=Drosophila guanche TaxID=7266 RepID=A0A3B0J280_DROGU|nr:phospholipase A2 large subunit [Drosophila guanche]SPP73142.1 blast:Phospholipase A2 [Drosophila guanche]